MKKIISVLLALVLLSGCDMIKTTPTKEVEEFLGKYQTMNSDVLDQLNEVVVNDIVMTDKQKEDYQEVMKRQYQNLSYKIKDETIDGDHATVEVEIEVYDYRSIMRSSTNYLTDNKDEFLNEDGTVNEEKFMDFKIKNLKSTNDKVTYTITFTLTKKDDEWKLDNITDIDRQKIHGVYEY